MPRYWAGSHGWAVASALSFSAVCFTFQYFITLNFILIMLCMFICVCMWCMHLRTPHADTCLWEPEEGSRFSGWNSSVCEAPSVHAGTQPGTARALPCGAPSMATFGGFVSLCCWGLKPQSFYASTLPPSQPSITLLPDFVACFRFPTYFLCRDSHAFL